MVRCVILMEGARIVLITKRNACKMLMGARGVCFSEEECGEVISKLNSLRNLPILKAHAGHCLVATEFCTEGVAINI